MQQDRRQVVLTLTALAGATLLPNSPAETQAGAETPARETVAGIGGFFFRAHDPKTLAKWYLDHLGINLVPTRYDEQPWRQEAGPTAFAPFPETSGYFGDPARQWMLNFRVHNLDRLVAQLKTAGIPVKVDPQTYPNGRFAHLHDPEGNPLELWQAMEPKAVVAAPGGL